MPCTAKKFEAARDEFTTDGVSHVDYVISTQELIQMIRESGIVFGEIEPEAVDMPFGATSGAGVIFGVTGGVTEAVIRRIVDDKSVSTLKTIAFTGVRGMQGLKEATLDYAGRPGPHRDRQRTQKRRQSDQKNSKRRKAVRFH